MPGLHKSNIHLNDTPHKATSVSQMLNWDIPPLCMQGHLRLFIEACGALGALSVSTSWKGLSSEIAAAWKAQPSKSQVLVSRPKIPPAASTEQYADPGVQARFETQDRQFNCSTTPGPISSLCLALRNAPYPIPFFPANTDKVVIELHTLVAYVNSVHTLFTSLHSYHCACDLSDHYYFLLLLIVKCLVKHWHLYADRHVTERRHRLLLTKLKSLLQ